MEHRFNLHLLLNLDTKRQGTHADPCRGAIRDIDRIGTDGFGMACALKLFLRHKATRRVHLNADHKFAIAQLLQQGRRRRGHFWIIVRQKFGRFVLNRDDFDRF